MDQRKRIGLREVRALQPGEVAWDAAVVGFGARRQRSDAVAYVLKSRTAEGRQRWHTIGRHGAPWTPETAREEARRLLGEVAKGADPAADKQFKRKGDTVGDLCDAYLEDAAAGRLLTRRGMAKKTSTLATDRGRIDAHVKPLLGAMKVSAVRRADIERMMHAIAEGKTKSRAATARKRGVSIVRGGKGAATRTVGLLGGIFTYAVRKGLRPDNPVTGTVRFADGRRERRLSADEYAALGAGLRASEAGLARVDRRKGERAAWPDALAATRFIALTGWRSSEALGLRWRDLDAPGRVARLPDTKTGASVRPLSAAALAVLPARVSGADGLVFRPARGTGVMSGFPSHFARVVQAGGLPADVTPHVLRHSFASLANELGFTAATVGFLIGHKGHGTTAGYIHSGDAVFDAAEKIARAVTNAMSGSVCAVGAAA